MKKQVFLRLILLFVFLLQTNMLFPLVDYDEYEQSMENRRELESWKGKFYLIIDGIYLGELYDFQGDCLPFLLKQLYYGSIRTEDSSKVVLGAINIKSCVTALDEAENAKIISMTSSEAQSGYLMINKAVFYKGLGTKCMSEINYRINGNVLKTKEQVYFLLHFKKEDIENYSFDEKSAMIDVIVKDEIIKQYPN